MYLVHAHLEGGQEGKQELSLEACKAPSVPTPPAEPGPEGTHLKHGSLWAPELVEGWATCGHLDDSAAQRPDVSRFPVPAGTLVNDFWGHVL